MFEKRRFSIISSGDASLIDFSKVCETSIDTLRYSVDGTKTFVKYDCTCGHDPGDCECCPTCITDCPSHTSLLTLSEIHAILATPEWTQEMPDGPYS
jgi:hypothetical protein